MIGLGFRPKEKEKRRLWVGIVPTSNKRMNKTTIETTAIKYPTFLLTDMFFDRNITDVQVCTF